MNIAAARVRLSWFSFPMVSLLVFLQRMPVMPLLTAAEKFVASSSVASVLRSVFVAGASLGAVHSLAGATTFSASPESPLSAKKDQDIGTVAMRVTGAPKVARAYTVSGEIPPGLKINGVTSVSSTTTLPKVIDVSGGTGAISMTGTPTKAGTYDIGLKAWENAGGSGNSSVVYNYRVVVAAAPAEKPAKPLGLGAQPAGKTSIALSWQPAPSTESAAPTGYRIERARNKKFTSSKKTITVKAVTSHVDTGLKARKTYYYRVRALSDAGASSWSSSAKAKTLSSVSKKDSRALTFANRVFSGNGDEAATGGFVIAKGAPKKVLLRAVGPTLTTQKVAANAVLKNPVLRLYRGSTLVAVNDDWETNANLSAIKKAISAVGAVPFAKSDRASSALLLTLPPGSYTLKVSGQDKAEGVVQIEVHDAD